MSQINLFSFKSSSLLNSKYQGFEEKRPSFLSRAVKQLETVFARINDFVEKIIFLSIFKSSFLSSIISLGKRTQCSMIYVSSWSGDIVFNTEIFGSGIHGI